MDIQDLRANINKIDDQMAELFRERMDTALAIAQYKKENKLPVLDRSREREILSRVAELVGEKYQPYAKILYSTLFDMSRSAQQLALGYEGELAKAIERAVRETPAQFPKKATVACQGVEGAYSQQACDKIFSLADVMYFGRFDGVFQAVKAGLCEYGILPIENSAAGSVTEVYDLMKKYDFYIARSIKLKVDHALLVNPGVKMADIAEVVSHQQAISQCSQFLKDHPNMKVTVMENTAAAAKYVAGSGRTDVAAISSAGCAELYGLRVLQETIQDTDHNYTRFICISKNLQIFQGSNRISLMFTIPHRPGSLYSIIAKFASLGLNLTKLESRPIPGKDFEFMFYFDLEATPNAPEVLNILSQLERELSNFAFLGGYQEIF